MKSDNKKTVPLVNFACSFTGLMQLATFGSENLLSKQVQMESDVPKYCMFFRM